MARCMRRRSLSVVLLLSVALVASACKRTPPKPGDACREEGIGSCDEATRMTKCVDAKWQQTTCRGPGGCATNGTKITCDTTKAALGDPCIGEASACTLDGMQLIECKGGTMVSIGVCEGPKGCRLEPAIKKNLCDQSVGTLGAPCSDEGHSACSKDHKQMLLCTGGKHTLQSDCGGVKGCATDDGGTVRCDASGGAVGDVCTADGWACSADAKSALKCKGGKLAHERNCKKGCSIKGDDVYCN